MIVKLPQIPRLNQTPEGNHTPMKTAAQVREDFEEKGIKISHWAMKRGINPSVVSDVLRGRSKGKYGASKKVVRLLGLKVEA